MVLVRIKMKFAPQLLVQTPNNTVNRDSFWNEACGRNDILIMRSFYAQLSSWFSLFSSVHLGEFYDHILNRPRPFPFNFFTIHYP